MASHPLSYPTKEYPFVRKAMMLIVGTVLTGVCSGQTRDGVRIEQDQEMTRVIAEGFRPVEIAAKAIRDRFGIPICVEDPILAFAGDLKDASTDNARVRKGAMIPSGGTLETSFPTPADPEKRDADAIVNALLNSINEQLSVKYRVDKEPNRYTLVPVQRRDQSGKLVTVQPLLDMEVSIPFGSRSIAETAWLMAGELSKKTGMTISCCKSTFTGIPWGTMEQITFGTPGAPAREILKILVRKGLWVSRCDLKFCFIEAY